MTNLILRDEPLFFMGEGGGTIFEIYEYFFSKNNLFKQLFDCILQRKQFFMTNLKDV